VEAVLGEPVFVGGKMQGISAGSAQTRGSGSVFCSINQLVMAKFPKPRNREFSRDNNELPLHIRQRRTVRGSKLRETGPRFRRQMAPKKALSGTRDRDAQESCRNGSKALVRTPVLAFEHGFQFLLQVVCPASLLRCLERIQAVVDI
jgi:hypothetical protein